MAVQFVLSKLGEGTPDPVNLEEIVTFTKQEDNRIQSSASLFKIVFHKSEAGQAPSDITWNYTKKDNRDCEYDKLIDLHGHQL